MTYRTTRTCHARAPDRRAAIGLSPTAYSSRPYPVRRSPTRMAAASGTNTRRLYGRTANRRVRADPADRVGHARLGLDDQQLEGVRRAEDDQAHAQGHDQRVDAEHADADAGDQSCERGGAPGDDERSGHAEARREHRQRRTPAIDATAPTERSIPPVSIVRVWQPARIASGIAARRVMPIHVGADALRARERERRSTRMAARPSSGMIGRSRKRPRQPAAAQPRAARGAGGRRHAHACPRRNWVRLPSITTPIRIAPCVTVARLGLTPEERHVRLDQRQDHHRDDRPEHAASTAGEAHAAEDHRGDARQRVAAGQRRADAGARR